MMSSGIFAENAKRELVDRVACGRSRFRATRAGAVPARDRTEHIISRAKFLAPADRSLVIGVFEHGMTPAEVAKLAGINAATARRRIRRLLEHMASDLFTFLMVNLDDWDRDRRAVALYRLMQRRSCRNAARESGLSLHFVRLHEKAILNEFACRCPAQLQPGGTSA